MGRAVHRSGKSDNLLPASIVAVTPTPAKYVWHYQTTPDDAWDYDSDQPMILADLNIAGAPRKVLMQANKNGFFYVLDRTTGAFISAKNFVDENWASGYGADGRPIPIADSRPTDKSRTTAAARTARRRWRSSRRFSIIAAHFFLGAGPFLSYLVKGGDTEYGLDFVIGGWL